MSDLLFYFLSTGFCLGLFVFGYQILWRNNTRFNLCRFYLIASILLSFLIPSMPIDLGISQFFKTEQRVAPVEVEPIIMSSTQGLLTNTPSEGNRNWSIDYLSIVGISLLSISLLLFIRFLYRFGTIILIQTSGNRLENDEGYNLIFTDKTDNAFSFLGNIFINPLKFNDEEKRLIIEHEREHIRHFHSIDLILIELLIVVQWFNPFAYIARRKLIEIHEFIADNGVIRKGADPYSYQTLLLSVVTSSCLPSAGNQLSAFITKKRIAMIGKPLNQTGNWINFLILIPIAAILILGISAFSPKSPVKNNAEIKILSPVESQDNSTGKEELMKRARNEIKDKNLKDFYIKLLPYGLNTELSQEYNNCYSVILKKDIAYNLYYFSGNNKDKLVAKIESGKLEEKVLETEIRFSYSTQITFKPKKTGAYLLSVGNLSSNNTDALMVLTLNERNIQNPESITALQTKDTTNTDNEVFMVVEQMPSFGNGGTNEFRAWAASNMQYPRIASENGIEGKVYVRFVIDTVGRLTNVRIEKGVDPALDKEAIRIIQSSPKWNPGKQRGQLVKVQMTVPIVFSLNDRKNSTQLQPQEKPMLDTLKNKIVEQKDQDEVFLVVEQMPSFGNGDPLEFRKWVAGNMQYPKDAAEKGIQGRVYLQFVVEKDGSITNVKVIRSVDPTLDKEAVRVLESSPKWNPGMQRGKTVRVSYTFPITFTFQ